jgi:hypothetical protein
VLQRQSGHRDKAAAKRPGASLRAAADPPARLQLGADSVAAVEAKLQHVTEELNKWRELAISTAYHEAA